MYTIIENLINHKFYKDVEEITFKLTLFTSYKVLSDEDYKKLMDLAIEKYETVKEENKVEEKPVETEITKDKEEIAEDKKVEEKTEVISQ